MTEHLGGDQDEIEVAPNDDLIFNAMRGLSREAQACLTKTVWKDGIDLEEPNAGCKSFVAQITEPLASSAVQRWRSEGRREMADIDRMEWQNGDMTDFNEEEFPEDINCCLHGVAWCEECPWCDEEEDELDFIVKAD